MAHHLAYKLKQFGFTVHKATGYENPQGRANGNDNAEVYFNTSKSQYSTYHIWGILSSDEGKTSAEVLRFVERGRIQCHLMNEMNQYLNIPSRHNGRSSTEEIGLREYIEAMESGHAVAITRDTDGKHYAYEIVADGDFTDIDNILEIHTANNLIILK